MQNTGQYGVSDPPQFVVGRAPPAHMFSLSHDSMSLSPSAGHGHPGHHAQHHHAHQQQQQQAQHHHAQHHHSPHPGHQPHPSLHSHQQQQAHQTPPPHATLAQHPQHPHAQHQQHQQAQHQPSPHQQAQQQHQQQQQQQQMVQQLGLGGPDSPEVPSPVASRPSPTNYSKQIVSAAHDDEGIEDEGRSAGGNRWPRQETLALIKIRSEMDANFRDSGLKGPLWEDVSRKLAELGYNRSAKKCKEKFENVHKYYKKTKDGRAGRQDGKNYRFFSQLEALYGGQHSSAHAETNAPLLLTGSAVGTGLQMVDGPNISGQRPSEHSVGVTLSESSEDDYDEPGGEGDTQENKKKRKRADGKSGSSKLIFFESLVQKLIDKQEAMQQKFLESMERREQDRQVRDEAWKRQEMVRLTREHELRAQEHALAATRDAALVAFLQRVTGQTLQLPQLPPPQPLVVPPIVEPVHLQQQQQQPQTSPQPQPQPQQPQLVLATIATEEPEKDGSFDPNSKRWPKPEVNALIRLRSGMETRFQEAGPKGPLWEEISTGMACLGYNRNSKRCKEKWENINKYFRKTKESNKKRPENAKTCPYFHQLDSLYRKGALGTPNSKANKIDDHPSDLIDHQVAPLNNREGQAQGGEAEILSILPSGEGGQTGASTSNGAPAQIFFSNPENGSSAERKC